MLGQKIRSEIVFNMRIEYFYNVVMLKYWDYSYASRISKLPLFLILWWLKILWCWYFFLYFFFLFYKDVIIWFESFQCIFCNSLCNLANETTSSIVFGSLPITNFLQSLDRPWITMCIRSSFDFPNSVHLNDILVKY